MFGMHTTREGHRMLIRSMAESPDTYAGFSAGYTTFGRLLHSDWVKILIKFIDSPMGECTFTQMEEQVSTRAGSNFNHKYCLSALNYQICNYLSSLDVPDKSRITGQSKERKKLHSPTPHPCEGMYQEARFRF